MKFAVFTGIKDVSDEDFNEDMNSISLTGEKEFSDKFNRKK